MCRCCSIVAVVLDLTASFETMTPSLNNITSELSDANISTIVNVTTATIVPGNLAGRQSPALPLIVRVTILLILNLFNLCGNGFTLITIRMTPRLWTKTNFILASMLVADVMSAVVMFWYNPFILAVYVFNNPCHFNVVVAALTPLMKITPFVNSFHLILMSVERYIAIVYPLHYENKFTDRTLKWALFVVWTTGILVGITYMLWLINADLRRCTLIPVQYQLVDILGYISGCICLFICYGKILVISWRHRRQIEPQPVNVNAAPGASLQTTSIAANPPAQGTSSGYTVDPNDKSLTGTGTSSELAAMSGAASVNLAQQRRHEMKSRRREFKAVYLTAAILGTFVILWFPHMLGRVLESIGYDPVVTSYISRAGGAIGTANFAFTWAIYAAASKSYRRAYRQMLIRIGCCCCKNVTVQADNSLIV